MILTPEQEYDMVEWVKSNPSFFNKTMTNYKNTELKKCLWNVNGGDAIAENLNYENQVWQADEKSGQ